MLQRPMTSRLLRFLASVDGNEAEAGKYGHSRIANLTWDVAGLWFMVPQSKTQRAVITSMESEPLAPTCGAA